MDFNNFIGGSNDYAFTFQSGSSISVYIDGSGHLSGDSVNMAALAGPALVSLGQNIRNVESITGNNTNSTLTGENNANNWTINGINDGIVDGVTFVDFNNLSGGTGDDTFLITGTGIVTGNIDGGAQVTADSVDYSNFAKLDITVAVGFY